MDRRNRKTKFRIYLIWSVLAVMILLKIAPQLLLQHSRRLNNYLQIATKKLENYFETETETRVKQEDDFLRGDRNYDFKDFKKDIANYTYYNYKYKKGRAKINPEYDNNFLDGKVELTVRMTVDRWMIHKLFCYLLRSAVLFWKPEYGPIVVILDEKDRKNSYFPNNINSFGLPFKFRVIYEQGPKNMKEFERIANRTGKHYGYIIQLYSSFLMDLYTNASIIAWQDSDTVMTFPILAKDIIRNGKVVAKGYNTFNFLWVQAWDKVTREIVGFPLAMDFMTYFPVYVLPSTIKGCREHIMKRYNVDNFEDAFIQIKGSTSPVNVIMNYAWYFQRDLYEWHFDTGKTDLDVLNKQRFSHESLYIKPSDALPEIHYSTHISYLPEPNRLPPAMCYLHFAMGHKGTPNCQQYVDRPNMDLFVFQGGRDHMRNWCQGRDNLKICFDLINKRYEEVIQLFTAKKLHMDPKWITFVENTVYKKYDIYCGPPYDIMSFS